MIASPIFVRRKPATMAGFYIGFADEQKSNENSAKNDFVPKAPSGRELSAEAD